MGAFAVFGSVEMLNIICSVIRTKLVALWIGPAGVGLFGLYNSAVEMLSNLTQMGIRSSGVKEIAGSVDKRRLSVIFVVRRYGFILSVAGLLLTAAFAPLLSRITFGDTSHTWAFMILSLVVMCNVIAQKESAILQGVNELRRIARAAVWGAAISLSLAVPMVYIWRIDSIIPVIVTYSVVMSVCYLMQRFRMPVGAVAPSRSESHAIARSVMRLGAYLTISGFMTWLVSYVVMSYMNSAGGERLMGFYQSGFTLSVRYAGIVFTALGMEYFPRIASLATAGCRRMGVMAGYQCVVTVMLVSFLAVAMVAFAPWIVALLYSGAFAPVVSVVILAAPGLLFRGVSWCMAYMIIAKGDGKVYMLTEIVSGALCVMLNVVCFRAWGIAGIGISFTLWYLLYALIVWRIVKVRYGMTFNRMQLYVIGGCVLCVCAVCVIAITVGMLPAVIASVTFMSMMGWWGIVRRRV